MEKLLVRIWENIEAGANVMHINNKVIKIGDTNKSKKIFEENFMKLYEKIANNYMLNDSEYLDRHKVAAIIIVSIIKSNVLDTEKKNQDERFTGNYILATDCGLSYMLAELNRKLENLEEKKVEKFYFPEAMACETDYYRIFYRNLYYANTDEEWTLNPLDIAERLFLLEYITLEKYGISPTVLKEY